jgi:two-component system invasion response regulator UvrY
MVETHAEVVGAGSAMPRVGLGARALWEALTSDAGVRAVLYDEHGRFLYCNQPPRNPTGSGTGDHRIGRLVTELMPGPVGAERLELIKRAASASKPLLVVERLRGVPQRTIMRAITDADRGERLVLLLMHLGEASSRVPLDAERYEIVHPRHNEDGPFGELTQRELTVLKLIASGLSYEEISRTLSRSLKTVEWHRSRLGRKLGLGSNIELTRYAIEQGLVELGQPRGEAAAAAGGPGV